MRNVVVACGGAVIHFNPEHRRAGIRTGYVLCGRQVTGNVLRRNDLWRGCAFEAGRGGC